MKKIIIELEKEDLKRGTLDEFYDIISMYLGVDTRKVYFKREKINISSEIVEILFESCHCNFPEKYKDNPQEFDSDIIIELMIHGPLISYELSGLFVEILPEFFDKP